METLWFILVASLLVGYVLLDGFDLGAGIVHLFAAKTKSERRQVLASIGPVWDGNEVWLLAAGGTLYFAFPALYAGGFSGFYLALMVVLWLLILRGIAIELRNHVENPLWQSLWDVVFAGASAVLAIFFGAALGNVVRGVPLDAEGYFFLPLWTDFKPGAEPGLIDWYTVSIGVAAFVALTVHGALWVAMKTVGEVEVRSLRIARWALLLMLPLAVIMSVASFAVQPHLTESFAARPWGVLFPAIAVAGLLGIFVFLRRTATFPAFLSSSAFLTGALGAAAFGLFPNVLPSNVDPTRSLTIANAAAPRYGLQIGLYWWIPAYVLALGYTFYVYRRFAGKVR